MKRYWVSWLQPGEDYRPLKDPPNEGIIGWWCSGYDSGDTAVLCALIRARDERYAVDAVLQDWPEFKEWRFCEEVESDWIPTSRFPLTLDWQRKRANLPA